MGKFLTEKKNTAEYVKEKKLHKLGENFKGKDKYAFSKGNGTGNKELICVRERHCSLSEEEWELKL